MGNRETKKDDWKKRRWRSLPRSESEGGRRLGGIPLQEDKIHSMAESRYYVLGRTNNGRYLFIVFTVRKNKIRVISARDMSRKERRIYREQIEKTTKIQE